MGCVCSAPADRPPARRGTARERRASGKRRPQKSQKTQPAKYFADQRGPCSGCGACGACGASGGCGACDDGCGAAVELTQHFLRHYGTGLPRLDVQHKGLLDTIEQLYNLAVDGRDLRARPAAKALFNCLVNYTRTTFLSEEGLMLRSSYEKYAEHKREHEGLAAAINSVVVAYDWGAADRPDGEAVLALADLVADHVALWDRSLGRWLAAASSARQQQQQQQQLPSRTASDGPGSPVIQA
eukprot:m51a1_g10688 hypothetical protein (241) ;mRNA; r:125883-126803